MLLNPLARKLQIKPGQNILLVNAPAAYPSLIEPLPENTRIFTHSLGKADMIQLFVSNSEELITSLKNIKDLLLPDTVFWVIYPKKSSGIKSDLDMMNAWEEPEKYGLRPVASAAIDSIWTAIRFRPAAQVKKSGKSNSEIEKNELGKYIDLKNKIITLPPGLKEALEPYPAALHFFRSLSWSNKREYVSWVLTAKQEKTKTERIRKTIEKLTAEKKNPAEK